MFYLTNKYSTFLLFMCGLLQYGGRGPLGNPTTVFCLFITVICVVRCLESKHRPTSMYEGCCYACDFRSRGYSSFYIKTKTFLFFLQFNSVYIINFEYFICRKRSWIISCFFKRLCKDNYSKYCS